MAVEETKRRGTRTLRADLALRLIEAGPDSAIPLRALIEQVLVSTGATLATVYATRERADELTLVEEAGVPRALYGLRRTYPVPGRSPLSAAHASGRPLWLASEDAVGDLHEPMLSDDGVSLAVLPLDGDGRSRGCLLVVDECPEGFDAEYRQVLNLFADRIAAHRTLPAPGRTARGNGVGNFSLTLTTGHLEVDARVLELFGLAAAEFDGQVETLLALAVPEDLPALMSTLDPGRRAVGRDLEFRIRRRTGELAWLRMRSEVSLGTEGCPTRLLGTVADASHLRPGVDDTARVQRLAATLATAVTVQDVGRAVVSAIRHPLGAARVALAELEAERLVVTMLDPPEPDAWPDLWRSEWRSEWPDAPVRAMPTLEAALREGRASVWPAGAPLEPALAGVGPGGLALLPLPSAGRVVGACLVGWAEPHEVSADERTLLTATATLAGQALDRARTLDAEHELVATLQRSLLPRRLPELPGGTAVARYLPAAAGLEVGGDWYDVIPLTDGRVALVIGDVQGHNAGAATLMGQMRTAIRAYAVEGHPADVVVSHANRLLVGMGTDLFATCCYVVVDMEEGAAWCARAGHIPPVLRLPDGTTEVVVAEGGPPLGVDGDAYYPVTPLALTPGTVLVLTTDGLVESRTLTLDDGLARLCEVLGRTEPGDVELVADALLGGTKRRDDDVAVLLLRYDGMGSLPVRSGWTVWRLPEAVSHARRFVARTLASWGLAEERDTALLVVSELVTNALVHTQGPVRLDLTHVADRLRIAVTDASPRSPFKPTGIGWEATGGRGILLVEAVSAAFGSLPMGGGKQVWSELAVRARDPQPGAGVTRRQP
ncbi:SpoIIE family protein phosphatase [Peterkaempfera bronchialis]|uniref:protein-serine/threonine phosphatase n=1 Tax=Peterkaempfera bronchialis TaxID=2126346 RepID=A0A345T379_9ACTN|nr:SpoIIE family protein phosphatase [Peterkaempfera bronchialis]AXI80434.1 PAS sensor protein [Peterkaempfera bronchialis]